MEKYLVFRLEKMVQGLEHGNVDTIITVPCFELVKEFEIVNNKEISGKLSQWDSSFEANEFARQYSLDNKVRCVVVKGTVFEG